jgi:hypothetical protein
VHGGLARVDRLHIILVWSSVWVVGEFRKLLRAFGQRCERSGAMGRRP